MKHNILDSLVQIDKEKIADMFRDFAMEHDFDSFDELIVDFKWYVLAGEKSLLENK